MKLTTVFSTLINFTIFNFVLAPIAIAQVTVDFDDISLPGPNSLLIESFESNGVQFNGGPEPNSGIYQGFVLSNATVNQDLSVAPGSRFGQPDFDLQQYSAYEPVSGASSNYAVLSFADSQIPIGQTRTAAVGALFALPNTDFESLQIANTTYAAHSIKIGDGFSAPFSDSDDFTLHLIGYAGGMATGDLEFTLASGTNVVDEFTTVSLQALADAEEIRFALSSSSTSTFSGNEFINPPAYVALDNLILSVTTVPEPGNALFLLLAGTTLWVQRRTRI